MTEPGALSATLADRIARLEAIEELRRLKADYFASVDGRDWAAFRATLADDCTFSSSARLPKLAGPDEFVALVRKMVEPGRSLHLGFEPRLEVLASDRARGSWPMFDRVEVDRQDRSGWQGFGVYRETYRRDPTGWVITSWHLERGPTTPLPPHGP